MYQNKQHVVQPVPETSHENEHFSVFYNRNVKDTHKTFKQDIRSKGHTMLYVISYLALIKCLFINDHSVYNPTEWKTKHGTF